MKNFNYILNIKVFKKEGCCRRSNGIKLIEINPTEQ
jgi:hypothetical protein